MGDTLNPNPEKNHLDTSQQINHVFGCCGPQLHVTPGFELLRAGNITKCPKCGYPVEDITDTRLGRSYLAFANFSRGDLR